MGEASRARPLYRRPPLASAARPDRPCQYAPSPEANPINQTESFTQLVNDMNSGAVGSLIILGVNAIYDSPADLEFEATLSHVHERY